MLTRFFALRENGTTAGTEIMAGITTFLTMAYIIFVQPAVLSGAMFNHPTGMDMGAVTTATCLSAALASILMGIWARYPVAQAPGMGQNFFFVLSAIPAAAAAGYANAWQVALGVVFLSGLLFLALSLLNVREALLQAISPSLKHSIAVGIGLFIAFIGLQNAGLIQKDPGTAVRLNPHFASPDLLIFFFGLMLAAVLHTRRVTGSILIGILGATALATGIKFLLPHLPAAWTNDPLVANSLLVTRFDVTAKIISAPPSIAPTFLQMDIKHALTPIMAPFIIVFLFMVLFDTVGTLIGVASRAGMMKDNRLLRARQAFASDATATTLGACLGTSTVTSFIESAAGVEQGGRTGLTAVVAGLMFLVALFFSPLVKMIGSYPPVTAPALVLVGAMMCRHVSSIDWEDYSEAIPAFLILIGIPMFYSIGDGLAVGFIAYSIIKTCTGRWREAHWIMHLMAALLVLYFLTVRGRLGDG
jgi:AGZA family xanthine/uracil permease-like MFS transporter